MAASCLLLCATAGGEEVVNSIGMKFVRIEPGTFRMGAQPGPDVLKPGHERVYTGPHWDETPVHEVRITRVFRIATSAVTMAEFARFKPEYPAVIESRRLTWEPSAAAVLVTWDEATAYCDWLSKRESQLFRLPTEAEWEFAATKLNRNVQEWCLDWWAPYSADIQTDPLGPREGTVRVIRGGNVAGDLQETVEVEVEGVVKKVRRAVKPRPTDRSASVPGDRRPNLGFRIVQAPMPAGEHRASERLAPAFQNVAQQRIRWTPPVDANTPFFEGGTDFITKPADPLSLPYWGRHHVPSITWCDNGDLLATAFTAPADNSDQMAILITRLRHGKTVWDPPARFFIAPDRNVTSAVLYHAPNGDLHHYNGIADPRCQNFSMIKRISTDNGASWSAPRIVHEYPANPFPPAGGTPRLWPHLDMVRLADGTLVLPSDADGGGGDGRGTVLWESGDNGESWVERSRFVGGNVEKSFAKKGEEAGWIAGRHAPFVVLKDGRYLAFGRSDDIDGHAPFSLSANGGKTWTYQASPFPPISSFQRPVFKRLAEGPIMLVSQALNKHGKQGLNGKSPPIEVRDTTGNTQQAYGTFAALSFDQGQSWPVIKLIPRNANAPFDSDPNGYLSCVQTPDGIIHLISTHRYYRFNLAWLKTRQPPPALTAADAHLIVGAPNEATTKAVPTVLPASKQNIIVFKEPGRYGGWPANHGLWQWGDELVIGFKAAWYKHATNDHAVDRSKPFENWQARSLDGGKTWKVENSLPFASDKQKKPAPLTEPLDFTAPDFSLMFCFGSLHVGPSWFYVSNDRCRTWRGPFSFAVEGIEKICTRTDLVVLGKRDCLMFGSAAKSDDKEGRVFCARTTDGGLHWKLVSLIGLEPAEGDFAIMPSTVRLPGGALITTIRHGKGSFKISAWRSDDLGRHWTPLGDATPNIGSNPPALVILKDGRLCLTYGYRRKPYGVRARISSDEGRTWGPEIILRDDGLTGDLGYPRSVVRPDGKVLTSTISTARAMKTAPSKRLFGNRENPPRFSRPPA